MRVEVCADCGTRWKPGEHCLCPHCIEKWVRESCEAQGVPVKVTDPTTIWKVATLLGAKT